MFNLSDSAVLLTVPICFFARPIGVRLRVIDHPDDARKHHALPTPQVGGIAIMAAVLAAAAIQLLIGGTGNAALYTAILCCGGGVAVLGFMDDQHTISASGRLLLLALFSYIALKFDPGLLSNRVQTLSFGAIAISPSWFLPLIIFVLVGFASAVNMLDGLTGLVMGLLCIWGGCLTLTGGAAVARLAQVICASSLLTLLFNLRGRLFLGDCGTFALAFIVGLLTLETHNAQHLPLEVTAVWFFLPIVDCLRLIPMRLYMKRSPFRPDKNHFHHRLAARFKNRITLVACLMVVGLTSLIATLVPSSAPACLIVLSIVYVGFLVIDAFAWDALFGGTSLASRPLPLLRATRVLSAGAAPSAQTLPAQLQRVLRSTMRLPARTLPNARNRVAGAFRRNRERRKGFKSGRTEGANRETPAVAQTRSPQVLSETMPVQTGARLPQKWGPILRYQSGEGGIIALSFIAPPDQKVSFVLRDRFGNLHSAAPIELRSIPLRDVNLVTSDAPHDAWLIAPGSASVSSGKQAGFGMQLEDEEIYFIASLREKEPTDCVATATLIDPVTHGDTPVVPDKRYRFAILAAADRCAAQVRLNFRMADGRSVAGPAEQIQPAARAIEKARLGVIAIDFVPPDECNALSVEIEKGRTLADAKSQLFFARPSLLELSETPPGDPIILSAELLQQVRSGRSISITHAVLESPAEMLDGRTGRAAIHARFGQEQIVIPDVIMESGRVVEVTGLALENDSISFSGQFKGKAPSALTIGLYVDGAESAVQEFGIIDRAFRGSMILDSRHLDGQPHRIELRMLPQKMLIGSIYEIIPMQITPWPVLQLYARPPLDAGISPAAQHHLRSYQLWFEHIQSGAAKIPPIAALHAELLRGFNKRRDYPVLAFERVSQPVVSIVVPVHNKFEVTYYCLCALQFAYNDTPFEIIVVDDGSSDETTHIDRFVKGVRVIRHDGSQGFVRACNAGAAVARGAFVAFLNNDTEVTARWLDELVSTFEDFENVGLVGSKLVYPSGELQEAGGIVWGNGNPWNVGRNGSAVDPRYNYLRQADYLSGASIMMPRALWERIGGFSLEMAPAYFEDTDLAMKVREAGLRVVYVPTSTVYHFEGQSAGTSTDTAVGMKRFQEINRPKFKRKWRHLYEAHGKEGERPDREKDRTAAFRVLFVDGAFPRVDNDAGSYAAFQEIRLLQGLGGKVTFLPRNLAWMDRHTRELQRIGVECLYAPYVTNFVGYLRAHAGEYDLIYITRYYVAEQVIPLVRSASAKPKIIVNLADLHFLRELREAAAGTPGYTLKKAEATRESELRVIKASDLTMSYSDIELAVLESHVGNEAKLAKLPWVVEPLARTRLFEETKDILFLGGFGHPPNEQAVKFFAGEVMPRLSRGIPDLHFDIAGSQPTDAVKALASKSVRVIGYVEDLDALFLKARVFVAPLLAGAGIKGKVLEAMARGVPSVLSPIAAESIGLTDGLDCLIARTPDEWVSATQRLYTDEALWRRIGQAVLHTAKSRYSFEVGLEVFRATLSRLGLGDHAKMGLVYKHARPGQARKGLIGAPALRSNPSAQLADLDV